MTTTNPLEDLIAANPELNAEHLTEAWCALDDPECEDPRAYSSAEQEAHQLVLGWLQHVGSPADDDMGERSKESLKVFQDRARVSCVHHEDGSASFDVRLRFEVLGQLLTDFGMMLSARGAQRGLIARDVLTNYIQHRMAEDVARTAWLREPDQS